MEPRIEMQPLAGRYVVAFKNPKTGDVLKVLTLNSTAGEMLRLHLDGHDIPSVGLILSERYGVPKSQVVLDAEALFARLDIK